MTVFSGFESPRPAALLRIALSLVLLCDAAARWPYAVELYSTAGPPMPVFVDTWLEPPAVSPAATAALHSLLVFALAAAALGWRTRTSLLVAFGLSAWLGMLDSPGTFKKYSVIALHLLLLLACTRAGAVWSLDRRLSADRRRLIVLSPVWPRRLMPILLASVYLGAAITKLRLPDFATGDLLEFSLLDDVWGGGTIGHWLAVRPRVLPVVSMGVILLEFSFPLLVWTRARRTMLVLAGLFHLALWLAMHLGNFSPVMLAALLAFVTERDLQAVSRWRFRRRSSVGSPVLAESRPSNREGFDDGTSNRAGKPWIGWSAYLILAAACMAGGGVAQWSMDWYGVFGAEPSRAEFQTLDAGEVQTMLLEQPPAWADLLHRFELGSRIDGGHAFGERSQFQRGTTVYALARFQQHHPPLPLDWILFAPDGREAGRLTRRLEAGYSHATAGFEITADAPAGRYRVVLQIEGYEAGNTWFEVAGPPK